ncbi:MAG TPA: hypothetical protein ACFYD6_07920 [Candidatus Brocadiia bacterium]|nr:hypothetical protein [Candidatus Brocadiales bacterium]
MRKLISLLLVSVVIPIISNPCGAANQGTENAFVTEEQVDQLISKVKGTIATIRGLEFIKPIKRGIKNRDELKEYLKNIIQSEMSDEKIYASQKALVKLGFIPPELDLKNFLIELYTEQVAGIYDWRVETLYLIREVPTEMQEIVIAHEITHALQDLHFNLKGLPLERKDNDDLVMATRAFIEGEAMLVMIDYMLKPMGVESSSLSNIGTLLRNATGLVDGSVFSTAPTWIQKNVLFPYLEGFVFVQEVKKKNDWKALNKCYTAPPQSTEQILHPEKYLTEKDSPTIVSLPRLSEEYLGDGWAFLDENVLGEFNVDLLFHQHFTQDNYSSKFANGWNGDLLQIYENKDLKKVFIAWLTTWDTDNDAKEFFNGYSNVVQEKYEEKLVSSAPHFFLWETREDMVYLELKGHDVLILEGIPFHSLNQVITHAW